MTWDDVVVQWYPHPTPKYVHVLTPGTCGCDLIWKGVFVIVKDLEMSSFWINLDYYDKRPHDRKAEGDWRQKVKIHKEKAL